MNSTDGVRPRWPLDRSRLAGRLRSWVLGRIAIDARALGALRMVLGGLVVIDVLLRTRYLVAFYTDAGVLPRSLLRSEYPLRSQLSIHALSGDLTLQLLLFGLTALLGLALLVGYRTRLATVGCLVLVVSMQARNPILLDAGDKLLRRLLLWGAFLPLEARYAIDLDRREHPLGNPVASVATAALLLQVVVVYVVNALFKLRGDIWLRGDAIEAVFRMDHYTILLGDVFAGQTTLLTAVTWGWLTLLLCSPLMILTIGRVRGAVATAFIGAHLGMALTLNLGIFSLVSVASLLVFLPSPLWDRLDSLVERVSWPDIDARTPVTVPVELVARVERLQRSGEHLARGLIGVLLVVMLLWNAMALGFVDGPGEVDVVAREVTWDMFAPSPPQREGWYVIPGTLASRQRVDAFHGGPVEWDRPTDLAAAYPSDRWLAYLLRIRDEHHEERREAFSAYLCRSWNRSHEDGLVELDLYYNWRSTMDPPLEAADRWHVGSYSCDQVTRSWP